MNFKVKYQLAGKWVTEIFSGEGWKDSDYLPVFKRISAHGGDVKSVMIDGVKRSRPKSIPATFTAEPVEMQRCEPCRPRDNPADYCYQIRPVTEFRGGKGKCEHCAKKQAKLKRRAKRAETTRRRCKPSACRLRDDALKLGYCFEFKLPTEFRHKKRRCKECEKARTT